MIEFFKLNKTQTSSITITSCLFIVFIAIGIIYQIYQPQIVIGEFDKLDFKDVLKHNSLYLLKTIVIGILTLNLYNFWVLLINGLSAGMAIGILIINKNIVALLTGLLPHAIFEIPSIIFGATIPLIFYRLLMKSSTCRNITGIINSIAYELSNLVLIAFILIFIAAFFECNISRY